MSDGVKFIRVGGRVIPLRQKSYTGSKTQERGILKRAAEGAAIGARAGAAGGAAGGAYFAAGAKALGYNASILRSAATSAFRVGVNVAAIGAVLGAAFGKRTERVKVKKKKWSSI